MGILNVRALRDWILLRGVNHMMATEKGFFMDARLGPVIQRELDTLKERVGEINSNLSVEDISADFTVPESAVVVAFKYGKILYLRVFIDADAEKRPFVINMPSGIEIIHPLGAMALNYNGWDHSTQMYIPVNATNHYVSIQTDLARYKYVSFNNIFFLKA